MGIADNTTGDLNYELSAPQEQYDIVTAFEVLAHLYNQGVFLDRLRKILKMGGKLYLATPIRYGISTSHGIGNYGETTISSITELLELKGFKIIRSKKYRSYPLRFMLYGIRPIWKALAHWYVVFECEKI